MLWYGMVWYGMVWCGVVWCGMVWSGLVWYGMMWCPVNHQPLSTRRVKTMKNMLRYVWLFCIVLCCSWLLFNNVFVLLCCVLHCFGLFWVARCCFWLPLMGLTPSKHVFGCFVSFCVVLRRRGCSCLCLSVLCFLSVLFVVVCVCVFDLFERFCSFTLVFVFVTRPCGNRVEIAETRPGNPKK